MKHLTNQEAQSLLDAVPTLYTCQDTTSLPARIFQTLRRIVSAEFYALDSFHPKGYWLDQTWQEPAAIITPEEVQIFGQFAHEHPLFNEFVKTGLPAPRKTSDFVTTQQYHRMTIYNEVFRKAGTDRQMIVGLPISPMLTLVLSLNRQTEDFTESERRLLTALKSHLITAYHNAEAITHLRLQQQQLEVALERAGNAAILFNMDGQEEFVTEQARVWLYKYFDTTHGSATELPDELTAWMTHYASYAMRDKILAAPIPRLEIRCGDTQLRIRLLIDDEAKQILLLMEEDAPISAASLEALGLTKREAEVLSWVMLNKTSPEIAILCSISQRTVQKHLEHIYIKLGVSSRSAAAQLAVEILQRNS